jgi:hypothetical protein
MLGVTYADDAKIAMISAGKIDEITRLAREAIFGRLAGLAPRTTGARAKI